MALAKAAVCAAKTCGRHFEFERFEQLAHEFTFVTVGHCQCRHIDRMHRQPVAMPVRRLLVSKMAFDAGADSGGA